MNFDAVKHGPAVWALMGVKWRDVELGNARVFQGWDAARLAGALGLDLADVQAAIQGPPAGAGSGAPVPPAGPVPPAPPAGIEAGSLWAPRRLLAVRPFPAGGFTLDPREAEPGRVTQHIERMDGVQVLRVAGGVVVAVVHPGACDGPAVVLRAPLAQWAGMFRPV